VTKNGGVFAGRPGAASKLGFVSRFLLAVLWHTPGAFRRMHLTLREIYFAGVLSLVIILMSGLFVGMVLSLQGYETLKRYGADEQLGILVALSLVRERLLGAIELFRVAPVSVTNILLGKYLGYTVFLGVITAVLVGLLLLLGIPFLGNLSLFVGLVGLLILASLGIGFLFSVVSTSDSQAVQLSMLVLLASIFFGGFFLPLQNFWQPILILSYALPLTHGIIGLQDIMLKGTQPAEFYWIVLGVIAAVTFFSVNLLLRRQFRHL